MTLRFLLVCEGSSDAALIPHISRLLLKFGLLDPQGISWNRSGPLVDKISEGLRHSGGCDLLLVHRDADSENLGCCWMDWQLDKLRKSLMEAFHWGYPIKTK